MNKRIRILIVDDHELFRHGLAELLKGRDELIVVGEAGDAQEAMERIQSLRPDVILLDIQMPVTSGLELLPRLRKEFPECHVLILTAYDREQDIINALELGAAGYVLKTINPEGLLRAVRLAVRGEVALSQSAITTVARHFRGDKVNQNVDCGRTMTLTPREREILGMIPLGLSNKEMASRLFISEHTVRAHLRNILDKLGLQNRVQAAAYSVRHGWVQPSASLTTVA